jgi:Yip1-like protein
MATTTATNSFLQRLIGAAALDTAIYEEVEADPKAGVQAAVVVVLSSLAAGIGARGFSQNTVPNIALISIVALMAWACWALVIYEIGARVLPESQTSVDIGQLMRTIGFAATPGLLRIFGFIPGVTIPAFVLATVWMLVAMIVAVRQALDYTSTGRAVAVCLIGWVLAGAFVYVLSLAFGSTVS